MLTFENQEPPVPELHKLKKMRLTQLTQLIGTTCREIRSPSASLEEGRSEVRANVMPSPIDVLPEPEEMYIDALYDIPCVNPPSLEGLIQMEKLNDECLFRTTQDPVLAQQSPALCGAPAGVGLESGSADSDEQDSPQEKEFVYEKRGTFLEPPSIEAVKSALKDINNILKPPRTKGPGYVAHNLDEFVHSRLDAMKKFMWKYINGQQTSGWISVSLETAGNKQ